jgi:ABC-type lipoprotein release transport system permease subunit
MLNLKIAWRNITRQINRSAITISIIGIGLAFFIWLWALDDGFNNQLVNNATGYYFGHLQVSAAGFYPEYNPKFSIAEPARIGRILMNDKKVKSVSPRIEAPVFLSSATRAKGTVLIGIDPENEAKVTSFPHRIKAGKYLVEGDSQLIIIGKIIAEELGVEVGDKIVVTAAAADGTMAQEAFRVKGLIDTGIQNLDSVLACVSLSSAQAMLGLKNKTTSFVIKLHDQGKLGQMERELKKKLGKEGFYVRSWQEIMPALSDAIGFFKSVMLIILSTVFTVMAVGTANTVMISVIERTRELGLTMALGTSGRQVVIMVVWETILLGILGIILGNGLGLALILITQRTGIDLSRFNMKVIPGAMSIVYPDIVVPHLLEASLLLLLLTVIISIFPAMRAVRLKPAEAIRFI